MVTIVLGAILQMNIEVVCHRGANEYAPENTYAAAQRCIDWGMDYVEVDVNTSKDGALYLMHGPLVSQTTNGSGYFGQLTSDEIDQLDAGSWFDSQYANERVPRLEPFLRWIKGKAKVFLDVKAAYHEPLLDVIYQTGFENECFLWSSSERWMRDLRKMDPNLALKINAGTTNDVAEAAIDYQANIVEVDLDHMNDSILSACREYGLKLMIYQQNKDRAAFRRVIDWGADMINLNHGDLFLEVAQQSNLRPAPPKFYMPNTVQMRMAQQ